LIAMLITSANCELGESVESLQGKQYLELPDGFCNGSSENTLGKVGRNEYVGLICERPNHSYILLQRLVGYTSEGKAIMQIVATKVLPKLSADEFSVGVGCVSLKQKSTAIFAIVKDVGTSSYQVKKAWEANLGTEQFKELDPKTVSCSNPLLGRI
jgi:hypothetical protein